MFKQIFDSCCAIIGILFLFPVIIICWLLAIIDTQSNGVFVQQRVGQYGELFELYKLRTLHKKTFVISKIGAFLRKTKLDELPQLFNILIGNMSFVGPRPDIEGYYDTLKGEEQKVLELKPGLTSDAALKYVNEEKLLKKQKNPLLYNDEVLFPDKVKLNLVYYYNQSFLGDLKIIFKTIIAVL